MIACSADSLLSRWEGLIVLGLVMKLFVGSWFALGRYQCEHVGICWAALFVAQMMIDIIFAGRVWRLND